jgi:hypothetical protein
MMTQWQDLRYHLRMLAKRVGFTLVAVLTLTWAMPVSSGWSLTMAAQSGLAGEAYINGLWFDGTNFRTMTFYVVNGTLTTRRPPRISKTVDLKGGFVIPPLADAHQHILNARETFAAEVTRFLKAGVYYVMVQDAMGEPPAEIVGQVGKPTSVDVAYAWAPLIGSGHGLLDFFKSLSGQGRFGGPKTLGELDTRAFLLLDTEADLERKWNRLISSKVDFIKVILAFSEEHDARRRDQRFYSDPGLSMARPGLPPKLLPLVAQRAHALGRRVSVHVETANDFRVAVKAGVDLIAHLPGWHVGPTAGFADDSLDHWLISDDDARLAAKRRVIVITTIYPKPFFDNARLADKFRQVHLKNLTTLIRNKVVIAIGADNDEATAYSEVQQLATLGVFDNRALLKMLVETTPRAIFPKRKIGYLQEGYEASFLVLDANPLDKLENLQRIVRCVKQGQLLDLP